VIYLDANATTPLHPAARAAWLDAAGSSWHNPSGLYAPATAARDLLETCRDRLAGLLDCEPARVVFTGGATAAANAMARHVGRFADPGATALAFGGEHPCVADPLHEAFAGRVEEIPCDVDGVVRLDAFASRIASGRPPVFVTVMAASNESGVLQPWRDMLSLCRRHGVPFHTDAAQWLGKYSASGLGACDWVTGSGHKFGAPKGIGFLVVPEHGPAFHGDRGGPQERGRHAGTEDVAAVAALVAALEAREVEPTEAHRAARDAAEARLRDRLPEAVIVSGGAPRLWNTLAVILPRMDARKLVARLAASGIAASTGSACSAGAGSTPRIIAAIGASRLGLSATDARGFVRFSASWETTPSDWITAIDALAEAVRPEASLPTITL
jgi:cysteine desulfurase